MNILKFPATVELVHDLTKRGPGFCRLSEHWSMEVVDPGLSMTMKAMVESSRIQ